MTDSPFVENFFEYSNDDSDVYPIQFFSLQNPNAVQDFIFVNGFSDPVQNHEDIFRELADRGYRVWAINMPGHGKSGKVPQVNWETLVEIVRTFVTNMGIEEHVMGGFSMGGGVALMYSGMYPDNIKAIRVLSPFCYGLTSMGQTFIGAAKFTIDFLRNSRANPSNKKPPSNEIYPMYYIPHYSSVIMRPIEVNSKALKNIPIDVVVGDMDEVVNFELVKQALGELHNAKFRTVKGLGHDIYFVERGMIEEIAEYLVK